VPCSFNSLHSLGQSRFNVRGNFGWRILGRVALDHLALFVHQEFGEIPEVECSPSQINQVFMNLLANAAQAIAGRGNIWIRTHAVRDTVEIQIEDSGTGMSPETVSQIFDPFFTTKKVGEGTGLGLSIAYGLIQKHNGKIDVKSEMGKGTVFTVVIPIKQRVNKVG
jgi:signal transduction histidine kinase